MDITFVVAAYAFTVGAEEFPCKGMPGTIKYKPVLNGIDALI
jgi:hypothetical protein